MTDPASPVVILYEREGCHLCEVALVRLTALQRTLPFRLETVDIAADPELERRYLLEVPVVAVDGVEVSAGAFDLEAVRRAVVGRRAGRADSPSPD